ncbi:MAG: FtsX-like permease family protein, partial [Promethearchaeota archaeon]
YSFPADFGGVIVNGEEMEGEKYGYITSASLFLAQATASSNIANKLETQARLASYSQIRFIKVSNIPPQETLLSLVGMKEVLMLNLLGSLLILAVLIIFFFGSVVYERKTEFAIMRVCGASTKIVKRLVFLEELLIICITLAEGYGLGLLSAWIFTNIAFPAIYYPAPIPYVLDIPFFLILGVLGLSFVVLIFGSTLASKQITGQKITLILKNL